MPDLVELQVAAAKAREEYDSSPDAEKAKAASEAQAAVLAAMKPASKEEVALGKALKDRADYHGFIESNPAQADPLHFKTLDNLVNDAVKNAIAARPEPEPEQAADRKPASAGLADIASKTRDEFRKNRYITDGKGKTHDSYNFWSPAGNVFRKPASNAFYGMRNFIKDHPFLSLFTAGAFPLLVGVYEVVRCLPGMVKDAFKGVGNLINATCNFVGGVVNGVCKVVSGFIDNLANGLDGVANWMVKTRIPVVSQLIAGALKCVSGPLHVVAKGVDKIGSVGQEAFSTVGAIGRLASNPLAYSSWRAAWRGVTQTVANVAMVPVEMVKETGTQLKELGNTLSECKGGGLGLGQLCRGAGNVVLASAVVTEGVVQGTKQFARAENGFKSIANGVQSGAATIGLGVKEAGQDFAAKIKGEAPARESGENQTKSAFGATVNVDQSHVVKPRSDAYAALTKETTGVLKENLKKTYDEQAEAQKTDAAAKKTARADKAGRGL